MRLVTQAMVLTQLWYATLLFPACLVVEGWADFCEKAGDPEGGHRELILVLPADGQLELGSLLKLSSIARECDEILGWRKAEDIQSSDAEQDGQLPGRGEGGVE